MPTIIDSAELSLVVFSAAAQPSTIELYLYDELDDSDAPYLILPLIDVAAGAATFSVAPPPIQIIDYNIFEDSASTSGGAVVVAGPTQVWF